MTPTRVVMFTRAAVVAISIGALAGCATNPVTGRSELSLVSEGQERQIGAEGYKAVVAEYGIYEDAVLQAYVDSVGRALARVSHTPNMQWKFTVLDDPAVNAFAMPGGYIYVTRGIMAHLNSEAQLAGVLGHEIGHVTARHSAQRLTQQTLAGLGLGLASIFSQGFARYSKAAETALGLMMLKYGRDDENQADQLGVDYSTAAGYDPREIPATYQTLGRVGARAGSRLPTFLSTHPDPGDRENRTTALSDAAAAGKRNLAVRERLYLKRQDGVVFGQDPRQGYFEGDRYYHPTLAFEIDFPAGWKHQDTKSAVLAGTETAAMQLTLVPSTQLSPSAYVAELERSGRIAGSQGQRETVGGYPAWVGALLLQASDGSQAVLAAAFIRASADRMFQILGRSAATGDADERRIFASMRSFRALTDSGRLRPTPDRVAVVNAPATGQFADVVPQLGAQALSLDDTGILNNADRDQTVRAGTLLKIVRPGRRR